MLRWLCLILLLGLAAPAAGRGEPSLHEASCATARESARGCAKAVRGADGWIWYAYAPPASFAKLPPGWHLLFSVTRFDRVKVVVEHRGRTTVVERGKHELGRELAYGNHFRVTVPVAGRDISRVRIGFANLKDPELFRSVKAMSPAARERYADTWRAVLMLSVTIVGTSLIYNLFLYAGLGRGIRRWYVAWAVGALGYMLSWSGAAFHLVPGLTGEWAKRVDFMLIGLTVGAGVAFFFAFIEAGKLPRWLIATGRGLALLVFVSGLLAAADPWLSAPAMDRLLNVASLASTAAILVGIGVAIARGSRSVWFYVVGWSPPIAVFILRIARNFGLVERSDLVDFATFAAFAFEAVVLSLAIGDRLRNLRRELDAMAAEGAALKRVARTDSLTGLANRAAFQEHLAGLEVGSTSPVTLFMIDLDYLKDVNDRAGHDAGDAMLVEAACRLRAAVGSDNLVARIGGDEFVIVSPAPTADLLAALARAQRDPWSFGGRVHPISFSIGYASWGPSFANARQLYKAADIALYEAKAAGRGVARAYSPEMLDDDQRRQGLVLAARKGLHDDEFEVHFQPVWCLRRHHVIAHEALLRWRRDGTLLTPAHFSELFDDPMLHADLQDFVLEAALGSVAEARTGGRELTVSVNFVASQLQGAAAARKLLAALRRHEVPPAALCVEVTENVVLRRSGGPIVECLAWLREAGIKVALDDFGTGYASLVHLRDLPADMLKIDRSFVARLAEDESSRVIVQAVVALASGLGKRVVAEGIETQVQLDIVRLLGCDYGQGYLLGRPAPLDGAGGIGDPAGAAFAPSGALPPETAAQA